MNEWNARRLVRCGQLRGLEQNGGGLRREWAATRQSKKKTGRLGPVSSISLMRSGGRRCRRAHSGVEFFFQCFQSLQACELDRDTVGEMADDAAADGAEQDFRAEIRLGLDFDAGAR